MAARSPRSASWAADIRCRISHKSVVSTEPNEEAAQVAQSVVLYIDPSVDIPEGSKITVTQNGMTRDYERSGKSAVYSCHQEVPWSFSRSGLDMAETISTASMTA